MEIYISIASILGALLVGAISPGPSFVLVAYFGTSISLILLSTILWKFPSIIARNIANFPAFDETEISSEFSDKLLQTGLIILGVYFLYYVISDFVVWGYYWVSTLRNADIVRLSLDQKSALAATFVELGLALTLTPGSKKIMHLIKTLRYGKN